MTEPTMRLSELCDFVGLQVDPASRAADDVYVGLEHVASGRFSRIGEGKSSEVNSSKYVFQSGDVLYGKLRPYLDKAVIVTDTGICTTELLVLRPKEGVDPRFLVSVVHAPSFIEHAVAGTTGVQHPRTSWNHIRDFDLPKFKPDEQTKIAKILWEVHDAIIANERAVEAGGELKRAAMRELFTKGLRGEAQKGTEIGPVPESWGVVQLGSLGRVGNGSTPKKTVPAYWAGGTYPWLTSAKVYDREIVKADQFVTDLALRECHLPRVEPGAILIAITGQGKTLGHCAVLRMQATLNQHVAYVATDQSRVYPSFVRGYLETQYEYLRQVGSGGGSTKGALTCAFLRSLPVPLPPTPDEQREIVDVLDAIDRKIDLHKRKRAVFDELFKALLHKLMTGEIRVADLDLSALVPPSATEVAA
jgi:type I restriction enzyme S subunit